MKLFFSWDDGHPDDIKLKQLFEKYEIPCMLFVPKFNSENRPVLCSNDLKFILSDLVEIGAHTYNHVYLTNLSTDLMKNEIVDGKNYLEDILNINIEHFCLPGGKFNKKILDFSANIFKTIRTANTMSLNYKLPLINTTFHFYPRGRKSILYNSIKCKSELINYFIMNSWKYDYFDFITNFISHSYINNKNYDIMIWGHSWELTQFGLWDKLEKLLKFINENYLDCCKKYSELQELQ